MATQGPRNLLVVLQHLPAMARVNRIDPKPRIPHQAWLSPLLGHGEPMKTSCRKRELERLNATHALQVEQTR